MESQKYLCRLCQRQTESMPFPLVKHLLMPLTLPKFSEKLFRIVCLCSLVSIVLCACGKNTNSEVNVTHISDGLESEYEWNSPEIDKLREKYPVQGSRSFQVPNNITLPLLNNIPDAIKNSYFFTAKLRQRPLPKPP